MKKLKLVQEQKTPEGNRVISEDEIIELFPLPKYFQIHFQNIHDNSHELKAELASVKQSIAQFDDKLEQVLKLLNKRYPLQ
ncbi:MAG: hypothetical protein GQ569_06940 [Methylococcaceae bacterium]|nr:hypothetical protein [Methylococcaceae bacterium]